MQCVRLLSRQYHWDKIRGRFNDLAFKPRPDGISVIDEACGISVSRSICEHIQKFYPQKFEEPIVFWKFDSDVSLPAYATLVQQTSNSGDTCHHNVQGISKNE